MKVGIIMALIVCPECGKEISDKSEACIHCGFPLINTKCNINGIIYDFKEELPIALLEKTDDYVSAIGKIRRKTSLTLADGCDLVDIIREKNLYQMNLRLNTPWKIVRSYMVIKK